MLTEGARVHLQEVLKRLQEVCHDQPDDMHEPDMQACVIGHTLDNAFGSDPAWQHPLLCPGY